MSVTMEPYFMACIFYPKYLIFILLCTNPRYEKSRGNIMPFKYRQKFM